MQAVGSMAGGLPMLLRNGATGRQLARALKGGSCRMETELLARHGRLESMSVSVKAIADKHGRSPTWRATIP